MVLHSLNIDIRSASFDLGGALEQLYASNDLRAELPGHAAGLTLQIERAGSEHALGLVPIDARNGVFAEHNLSGCPAFYAGGRFYARGDDGLEIEFDLDAHAVRANVGGRRAADARMVAIHVVRGILQSFLLPFYGLHAAHGAVVADGERTVMLTGRGGAGKTTAALYLQHHGFELLSDDAPLFVAAGGEALALSSLDYHHVTPATVDLLPWLAEHVIGETDIRGKLAVSQRGLQPGDGWRRPRRVTHVVELHRGPVAAPRLTSLDRAASAAALIREEMVVFRAEPMHSDERFARYSAVVFDILTLLMRDARVLRLDYADAHLAALPALLGGLER